MSMLWGIATWLIPLVTAIVFHEVSHGLVANALGDPTAKRRGRLGVIYSNKDYGRDWDYDWRNKRFRARDNTQFAVNLVVYCMT